MRKYRYVPSILLATYSFFFFPQLILYDVATVHTVKTRDKRWINGVTENFNPCFTSSQETETTQDTDWSRGGRKRSYSNTITQFRGKSDVTMCLIPFKI